MVTVDSKGRVVIPQEVRRRLGITPGTEVEVRGTGDRVVVEIEEDPNELFEDLQEMIAEASGDRADPDREELDPIAADHVEVVRRGATEESERGDGAVSDG